MPTQLRQTKSGESHQLRDGFLIGRTEGDLILQAESSVSGRHCVIMAKGSAFSITDLGSRNGTFVNGAMLERQVPRVLRHGDSVLIGSLEFTFLDRENVQKLEQAAASGAIHVDDVTFDTRDVRRDPEAESAHDQHFGVYGKIRIYTSPFREMLNQFLITEPNEMSSLDLASLRRASRESFAANDGALVEADILEFSGIRCHWVLGKIRNQMRGFTYTGDLTIPFPSYFFKIVSVCDCGNPTGAREAMVFNEFRRRFPFAREIVKPKVHPDGYATGSYWDFEGWGKDAYDPAYNTESLRCMADDAEFDTVLPTHGLSLVRKRLRSLRSSLQLGNALKKARVG